MQNADEPPAAEPSPWYRGFESLGVVIALIGGILWGLAAKPGNSDLLLSGTIVVAGIGAALLLAGLVGHWTAARNQTDRKLEHVT